MSDPTAYHFTLPDIERPEFIPLNEEVHPDFNWLTQHRSRSRRRDVFNCIDTIVIHATAGYATQHAVDTWKNRKASAHWIIPDEDEPQHGKFVWATVAEAKAAYHVGSVDYEQHIGAGTNVNNRSLGIEIVNTQNVQSFSDPFSQWQIESAARIVLYCWAKYPNLKHVISHAKLDPTRRSDPGTSFPWNVFRELVLSHSGLGKRDPLVLEKSIPSVPVIYPGNCCEP